MLGLQPAVQPRCEAVQRCPERTAGGFLDCSFGDYCHVDADFCRSTH